ncbi:hypothetical protein BBJ28_00022637 [Nothophytophthora sp. Chile5]|nr:hypothetical protein BBJ28_00022637 [Nothophytophthora sp. Chile5]
MISQELMRSAERSALFPLLLLANFAIFQYLTLLFRSRWREPYVLLMLFTTTLGWVSLVPFAAADSERLQAMNDVSEGSLALLLLVQTAFVGVPTASSRGRPPTDTSAPAEVIAIPTTRVTSAQISTSASETSTDSLLMRGGKLLANLLILFDFALLVLDTALMFLELPPEHEHAVDRLSDAMENVTLAFTLVYRFGLLARGQNRGWRHLLSEERLELVCHIIFATHEYPFMLLESTTGVSWEFVQALYMRLMFAPCLWMTIGDHHFSLHLPSYRSTCHQASGSGVDSRVRHHAARDRVEPSSLAADAFNSKLESPKGGTETESDRERTLMPMAKQASTHLRRAVSLRGFGNDVAKSARHHRTGDATFLCDLEDEA